MDPHFIKFRYTFADGIPMNERYKILNELSERLEINDADYCSAGIEELDKLGDKTHPHVHIHYITYNKKNLKDILGSTRRKLQRYFGDIEEVRKGNCLYSLVEETDVKDVNRFLRYPYKQGGGDLGVFRKRLNRVPEDFDEVLEKALAKEEYERMVEFNRKKRDESLAPSTKDNLMKYLTDIHQVNPFTNKLDIAEAIVNFYDQEEKSMNTSTMEGYLHLAVIRFGLMSKRDFAKKYLLKEL